MNVDVSAESVICEKYYVSNLATVICETGKYLASIRDHSLIMYDEIIKSFDKETKAIPTNISKKKATVNYKISVFYLYFY